MKIAYRFNIFLPGTTIESKHDILASSEKEARRIFKNKQKYFIGAWRKYTEIKSIKILDMMQ